MQVADGEVSVGDKVFVVHAKQILVRHILGGLFWDLPSSPTKMNVETTKIFKFERNALKRLRLQLETEHKRSSEETASLNAKLVAVMTRLVELDIGREEGNDD